MSEVTIRVDQSTKICSWDTTIRGLNIHVGWVWRESLGFKFVDWWVNRRGKPTDDL